MELDELKIFFKEKFDVQQPSKSVEEISLLLGKKAQSVVSKLKRSLLIELIACILLTLACIAIAAFSVYTELRIYFSIFAVLCFLFLPLLWFLLKKTEKLSNTTLPVKSNLESLVKILREYIKRYFQITMAMIPISLILVIFLGYNVNSNLEKNLFTSATRNQLIFFVAWTIAFTIVLYYFTKWYLKKLYGNYLNELQELIKELEE